MSETDIDVAHSRAKVVELREELEQAELVGNSDVDTLELDQQRQGKDGRVWMS